MPPFCYNTSMKKINNDVKLKNVVAPKATFQKFMSNYTNLKKADNGFYLMGDRRVDHSFLEGDAKGKGLTTKDIPSREELKDLV